MRPPTKISTNVTGPLAEGRRGDVKVLVAAADSSAIVDLVGGAPRKGLLVYQVDTGFLRNPLLVSHGPFQVTLVDDHNDFTFPLPSSVTVALASAK
eukprot:CAMPEP_0181093270 /NCGR_PEP_ID=MMETSP1071-20121207/9356_1 /TAXON_ID=35127 /ORGANISM="Thalassiosira sp., Strain NH16" /LENGTH=95 /DNA_ID=CAMNT_0023175493 /DNA_START=163 /DNA_END=450 /DNA_ORIENTATION=+